MARNQPDTSRLSYEKIMQPGARESTYKKVLDALNIIMDGTAWEISNQAGLKPDKVWKRLSELRRDDVIFDTGLRRNSPDQNPSMVYALSSRRMEYADVPKPERIEKTTTADYANAIFAGTAAGKKLFQAEMFEEK